MITPLGRLRLLGDDPLGKVAADASHPILNFEYQGGMTLGSFATHADEREYNTVDEAFGRSDRDARANVNGCCDWACDVPRDS